jgi:FolB domain-containing protein
MSTEGAICEDSPVTHNTDGDRIYIRDLKLECIIGVNPEERVAKQPLILNIVIFANLETAGSTDLIDDTIDYGELANKIIEHVEHSSCLLIEKVAEDIARICLVPERAEGVTVLVEKPEALGQTGKAGVEIYRRKGRPG